MATELYVGNLAYEVTDDDLRELFAGVGEVRSAKVIIDRMSGRSKGFGFVDMASEEDVEKAIRELDQQPFRDRNLRVDRARGGRGEGGPRRDSGGEGFRGRRGDSTRGRRSRDDWG